MTPAARAGALLLAALMTAASSVAGQAPPWQTDQPATRVETSHLTAVTDPLTVTAARDGRVTLRVHVTPAPRMRVYAHDVTGYRPLSLEVAPMEGLTVRPPRWPASQLYVFPPTGEVSRVFDAPFVVEVQADLSASLRRAVTSGSARLTARLRYQACDDRLCYRPAEAQVAWASAQ